MLQLQTASGFEPVVMQYFQQTQLALASDVTCTAGGFFELKKKDKH